MKLLLVLFLACTAMLHATDPVVSNLSASQREGTKLVDITYNVTAVTPTVTTTLRISSDSGATFEVPAVTLSGDIGADITVGTGKTITWDAGSDWDEQFSETMRFELTADDGEGGGGPAPAGFALIPGGNFTMGRTSGDTDTYAPSVNVDVSEFYMATHEVTWELWNEVRNWAVNNGYTDLATGGGKGTNHPVHTVNWWDVVKWCNARSEMDGLTAVYTNGGNVMRTGTTAPVANWSANGYRLPTEAEWEKAARGGVSGQRFPWGDTISHANANFRNIGSESYRSGTTSYHPTYNDGTTPYTSPVGSFAPNGYGLFDMSGNVWEWNWDRYSESTYTSGASDPKGPASGSIRVLRGGSWLDFAIHCRSAFRNGDYPGNRNLYFGFRPARSSVP